MEKHDIKYCVININFIRGTVITELLTVILEAISEVRQKHSKQLSSHKWDNQHRRSASSFLRNQYSGLKHPDWKPPLWLNWSLDRDSCSRPLPPPSLQGGGTSRLNTSIARLTPGLWLIPPAVHHQRCPAQHAELSALLPWRYRNGSGVGTIIRIKKKKK